ncbi:MAG: hypothetical protein V9E85_03100 [Candidatus Nanopelagicales bacterium]
MKLYSFVTPPNSPSANGRTTVFAAEPSLSVFQADAKTSLEGVTASDSADAVDIPTALIADALNVYRVSLIKPDTVYNVTADPVSGIHDAAEDPRFIALLDLVAGDRRSTVGHRCIPEYGCRTISRRWFEHRGYSGNPSNSE